MRESSQSTDDRRRSWRDLLRNSNLYVLLSLTLVFVVTLMIAIKLPVDYRVGDQNVLWHISESCEMIHLALPLSLVVPWVAIFFVRFKRISTVISCATIFPSILANVCLIYLKLIQPADELTPLQNVALDLLIMIMTFSVYLYLLGGMLVLAVLALPAMGFAIWIPFVVFYGIVAHPKLLEKGYEFKFLRSGLILIDLGYPLFHKIPPRDEMNMLPGFSNGTGKELVKVMVEIDKELGQG